MKRDKLRGECENSQVTEELAVCTEEVEQLKEQVQCCDKEWQERLRAETDRWQERLEEQQQDVETEQAKMAEAVAGIMCYRFWKREIKQLQFREWCVVTAVCQIAERAENLKVPFSKTMKACQCNPRCYLCGQLTVN